MLYLSEREAKKFTREEMYFDDVTILDEAENTDGDICAYCCDDCSKCIFNLIFAD